MEAALKPLFLEVLLVFSYRIHQLWFLFSLIDAVLSYFLQGMLFDHLDFLDYLVDCAFVPNESFVNHEFVFELVRLYNR